MSAARAEETLSVSSGSSLTRDSGLTRYSVRSGCGTRARMMKPGSPGRKPLKHQRKHKKKKWVRREGTMGMQASNTNYTQNSYYEFFDLFCFYQNSLHIQMPTLGRPGEGQSRAARAWVRVRLAAAVLGCSSAAAEPEYGIPCNL